MRIVSTTGRMSTYQHCSQRSPGLSFTLPAHAVGSVVISKWGSETQPGTGDQGLSSATKQTCNLLPCPLIPQITAGSIPASVPRQHPGPAPGLCPVNPPHRPQGSGRQSHVRTLGVLRASHWPSFGKQGRDTKLALRAPGGFDNN